MLCVLRCVNPACLLWTEQNSPVHRTPSSYGCSSALGPFLMHRRHSAASKLTLGLVCCTQLELKHRRGQKKDTYQDKSNNRKPLSSKQTKLSSDKKPEQFFLSLSQAAVVLAVLIIQEADLKETWERRLHSLANYTASSERPKGLYASEERKDLEKRNRS